MHICEQCVIYVVMYVWDSTEAAERNSVICRECAAVAANGSAITFISAN